MSRRATTVLVLLAAGGPLLPRPSGAQVAPPARRAAPDTLISGCTGGVSGGGGGVLVTSAGAIVSWTQATYAAARVDRLLRVDTAAAAGIFRELARIRFRNIDYSQPGNMTCSLELTGSSGQHSVAWPIDQPPASVRGLYERINGLDRPTPPTRRSGGAGPRPLTP